MRINQLREEGAKEDIDLKPALKIIIVVIWQKVHSYLGYVPQYQPAQEIQFWGTVAAVLIVGGTIAEDVITGGGGIADDAASFYLAYRLMFGL